MPKKVTTDSFIENARKIHGLKYDYTKTNYINNNTKIKILCPIHGTFEQTPQCHLQNNGCTECGGSRRRTTDEFIIAAKKVHGDRYDYSKVYYVNNHTKVIIICKDHGEFTQNMINHVNHKKNCPKCYGNAKLTLLEFVNRANIVHDNKYDYSKFIYRNFDKAGIIVCKAHGEFNCTPNNHLKTRGCPKCSRKISKKEIGFLIHINLQNIPEYRQKKIKSKWVDGYDPISNTVYEFLGDYWHGNPKKYNLDSINPQTKCTYGELNIKTFNRLRELKEMGYNVKYIWENDWNKYVKGVDTEPKILTL